LSAAVWAQSIALASNISAMGVDYAAENCGLPEILLQRCSINTVAVKNDCMYLFLLIIFLTSVVL
jgi:hypothetical protein